jgi:hypothetical protein
LKPIVTVLSKFVVHCDSIVEMKLLLVNLEKIVSFKKLMKEIAKTDCASLIRNISKLLERKMDQPEYDVQIDQLLRFCKKLGKQSDLHIHIVECDLHMRALEYIENHCYTKLTDSAEVTGRLQTIQNVMNLVKHLFEGSIPLEAQKGIAATVSAQKDVIETFDSLLEEKKKDEDLSIMIVNIIICFNSISNARAQSRVRSWITIFSS